MSDEDLLRALAHCSIGDVTAFTLVNVSENSTYCVDTATGR